MISRVAGLLRDMVFAHTIPAIPLGSFLFAFSLPNMLRDMLGEGAVNAALVPVLSQSRTQHDDEEYRQVISSLMTLMLCFFVVLTVVGILLMPLAPGLLASLKIFTGKALPQSAEELEETVRLMQWTFPYLFFIGTAVFAMAPLFVARHYSTPAWTPAVMNFSFILCAILLGTRFDNPAWALVTGVWVGGLIQLAVLWFAMFRHIGLVLPTLHLHLKSISRALWLLFPVILGQAAGEVNKLVDRFFALSLGEDTVLALYISNRLVQLPLSIFGVSVAVALLPALSKAYVSNKDDEQQSLLSSGLRQAFFLTAPAAIALIVLRHPVIRLLFQRGEFGEEATNMAAGALLYAALGLVFFAFVKVMVQGFYARQSTRLPVIIASGCMILNIILNALLVGPMGYQGLALATSISYAVNFLILFLCYSVAVRSLFSLSFLSAILKIIAATFCMGVTAWFIHEKLQTLAGGAHALRQLLTLGGTALTAGSVYALLCFLLNIEEFRPFRRLLFRR